VTYRPTYEDSYLEGEYDELDLGLADDLLYGDEGQEIGALWRDDEALLDDDLEDDPIAILSAGDDDALAYIYEDELDAPQLVTAARVPAHDRGAARIRRHVAFAARGGSSKSAGALPATTPSAVTSTLITPGTPVFGPPSLLPLTRAAENPDKPC
jgi:hypothetical protein